jgi:hypothetical protein
VYRSADSQFPARSVVRWLASCSCALALLLSAGWLASCGGDDDGGGGIGGLKRPAGGDIEGGGPPRPGPPPAPAAAAPAKKVDPNAPKVAPPSAAELARKRAAWDEFQQHRESPLTAPAADDAGQRDPNAPLPQSPGTPASLGLKMKAWYADYNLVSTAVKLALSRYTQAHDSRDESSLRAACQELKSATERLLGDPAAFASPDAAVDQRLRAAYQDYQAGAASCIAGQAADRESWMAAAQQALKQAADALRPYQLAP